jgi:tRNA(Ile)-lysidine synthase
MIQAKLRAWIERHELFPRRGNVLAACSGGPDSLALVDLLVQYQETGAINLFVAHFDHGLRGEASRQDAEFVRLFCAVRGLPFFCGFADVPALLQRNGGSVEEVARKLRYEYLRQILTQLGGGVIATGHHRDDQAETVLLTLLRGGGWLGLSAMQPRGLDIIRPLLCLNRVEIDAYCRERDLQPRTDDSNSDVKFMRNRVRHELMPVLIQRFNPAVTETLCRTADVLAEGQDFLRRHTLECLPNVVERREHGYRIDAGLFAGMHVAIQRELLRELLEQLRGDTRGIGYNHIEQIRQLFLQKHGARRIDLPGNWQARKNYQDLYLEALPSNSEQAASPPQPQSVLLACPGKTVLPEFGVVIHCSRHSGDRRLPDDLGPHKAVFDCAALQFPLGVRRRLPGDLFQPLGAPGKRKLKKLLIDLKISAEQRDRLPLIFDGQGIIWVAGLRRSERGRVNKTSQELIVLEQTKIDYTD